MSFLAATSSQRVPPIVGTRDLDNTIPLPQFFFKPKLVTLSLYCVNIPSYLKTILTLELRQTQK